MKRKRWLFIVTTCIGLITGLSLLVTLSCGDGEKDSGDDDDCDIPEGWWGDCTKLCLKYDECMPENVRQGCDTCKRNCKAEEGGYNYDAVPKSVYECLFDLSCDELWDPEYYYDQCGYDGGVP